MHRHAVLKEYSTYVDPLIPDEESLLIQLCEHLHRSGFLFDDATEAEFNNGEQVIREFYEQEGQLIQKLLQPGRLQQYMNYLKRLQWNRSELRNRLRQKVMKHFETMAHGAHHQFNIRLAIMQGLKEKKTGPFQDFMLCLQAYQSALLKNSSKADEKEPKAEENYTAKDLLKMRKELQDQLEGKGFVQAVLKQIAKKRGVSVSELTKDPLEEENQEQEKIIFVRPSKQKPGSSSRPVLKRNTPVAQKVPKKSTQKETPPKPQVIPPPPVEEEDPGAAMMVPELEDFEESEADSLARQEDGVEQEAVPEVKDEINEESPTQTASAGSSDQVEIDDEDEEEAEAPKKKEAKPAAPSAADLLSSLEEDDDEDFEEDDGLTAVETDETDVVFGTGKITPASMMSFVRQYPDSTLKFLLRRNLDGRPLPSEFDQIYKTWEERGLMRGRVRRYVLQIMDWEDVPDLPVHELLGQMRNRLMDMKLEAEQA